VAHIGQELAFGLVCGFRRIAGAGKLRLGGLQLAQVHVQAVQLAPGVRAGLHDVAGEHRHKGAVLAHELKLSGGDRQVVLHPGPDVLHHLLPHAGRDDELLKLPADGLVL